MSPFVYLEQNNIKELIINEFRIGIHPQKYTLNIYTIYNLEVSDKVSRATKTLTLIMNTEALAKIIGLHSTSHVLSATENIRNLIFENNFFIRMSIQRRIEESRGNCDLRCLLRKETIQVEEDNIGIGRGDRHTEGVLGINLPMISTFHNIHSPSSHHSEGE